MAKIKKIQEQGQTIYPATITQAIKDGESGKGLDDIYAKQEDNYPKMSVGFSENVLGDGQPTEEVISFRPTATENRNVRDGAARIEKVKGNSVVWNQLVDTVTTSVTLSANHIYITNISGVITRQRPTIDTAITVDATTDKVTDLTKMFTAGNEPTTIEEFYQRMPVGIDPNAYEVGRIVDGNYGAIKTTGYNQFNGTYAKVLGGYEYHLGGTYTSLGFATTEDGEVGSIELPSDGLYTPSQNGYIFAQGENIDIHLNWSEYNHLNEDYHPYKPFERDLSWVVKYFPNGMRSAGNARDEIRFNSTTQKWEAVQNVGAVDLGELVIKRINNNSQVKFSYFAFQLEGAKRVIQYPYGNYVNQINSIGYTSARIFSQMTDMQICVNYHDGPQNYVYIRDDRYSDADTYKNAVKGQLLHYELAEPIVTEITENVNFDYDVSDYGTEELIANGDSAPLVADIVYEPNVLATIKNQPDILKRLVIAEEATSSANSAATRAEEKAIEVGEALGNLDETLTELSAEVKNVNGVYTLDFEVKASGVHPRTTFIEYPADNVVYVGVEDKDNCIKYIDFYGYKADDTSELIVDDFVTDHLVKLDGQKYTKVGVYIGPDMVTSAGIATLKVIVGNSAIIEQIETESTIDEQIVITPTISQDGYCIDENLAVTASGAYIVSAPIFLKKGDKVFYKALANGTFAQLSECDKNGVLLELLQNGTGDRPFYHNYIAPKDMYVCICSNKANIGDVVIQRNIKESISLVEEKISKRVTALESTSFLKNRPIKNLCDISKATKGIYVKYDGSEGTSNSHRASDFIPVVYGETYSMPVDPEFFGAAQAARIVCFNSKKEYIGGITGTLNGAICTITITNSAAYIRTTIRAVSYSSYKWGQNIDTYMVVNSDKYPSRYIPYGDTSYYADYELAPTTNEMVNPLFGKSVVFDGDSICNARSEETSLGWAGRIGRKNMMLWQNYAIGGGTITSISGKHIISTQSYDNANPDYIIIEGGTNDADVIGSILNGQTPAAYGSYEPNRYDGDYDNTTFCGAVEFLFKRLLTTYPSAKIGVIIAPKMSVASSYTKEGNNRRAYFETLIQLCKKWGIPYLNLWDRGRLNPALSVYYNDGEDSFYTDGQHLTSKGYDVITPMIEAWMKTL